MAVKAVEFETGLIDSVCARVKERLADGQAADCEAFVRQYYHWVPPEDLIGRTSADLYGAAMAQWTLAQERPPGSARVRVYNPDLERHGWRSTHTVVEIVSDDMPFIVDSLSIELARQGYGIHLLIHPVIAVLRDEAGKLERVLAPGATAPGAVAESFAHVEVDRETDSARLEKLAAGIERMLGEVRAAVEDWPAMRGRAQAIASELAASPPPIDAAEVEEAGAFLAWAEDHHFVFLGYREYTLVGEGDELALLPVPGSGLGILRDAERAARTERTGSPEHAGRSGRAERAGRAGHAGRLPPRVSELARAPQLLVLTKANSRATVHRPAYLDYIGVKRFGPDGQVTGERRFLGLYTTAAYTDNPRAIPIIREKVEHVLARAAFPPGGHDAKALVEVIEAYPRDSLFQITDAELFEAAMRILGLGERQRLKLLVRRDAYERFLSCLVFIPRDRFNTENRERVGAILTEAFGATRADWSLYISESVLVRVHYVLWCDDAPPPEIDEAELEARLKQAIRAWGDDLREALIAERGEEVGTALVRRYQAAFPPAYRADWGVRAAVADIGKLEELTDGGGLVMGINPALDGSPGPVRGKLFSATAVTLSDVLPTFEHMGARVTDERPYAITGADGDTAWIYDFGLTCGRGRSFDDEHVREIFQAAFLAVCRGELENDGLGALVLGAELTGRQITVLRTVDKYLRQAGITFSDQYIERTLLAHPAIARLLVELFEARFDPERRLDPERHEGAELLAVAIEQAVDAVESLDEDRILRSFLSVLRAAVRTNYFQAGRDGAPKSYVSLKLDPSRIPILPRPRPQFEIFVYSPRVEGVHLRGGRVARGGLRWSERPEDFRTEVLGLMKAQMVKNALIVPVGSKGGFVIKRPPSDGGREALQEEVLAGYRTFLRGLLDLTDNIVDDRVVPPPNVVRYDGDDPYLVVAADKGTATFSDVANAISAEYRFWLGDAFASGGSHGYDHKRMGITARGAWESVKRHFRELGIDTQSTDFTVVGIGDMSGDVFGNGMLLSRHIKLVGAFNHRHIFLDPNPDPQRTWAERERLFALPRSSWSDYDEALISPGGGVYARTAKLIPISPEIREALAIEAEELTPSELIRELLCANVDLLWNGGIGTYVKASSETHADAGDKTNDALRVDGGALRCRVVGEGGNLGFTQRARVEYALTGGRINTDAIDNVAGVNCSDHEVNIKILLDAVVAAGEMSAEERNELLREMTGSVGERVVYGSYTQTQAMSLALASAPSMVDVHERLLRRLEHTAHLDRGLEALPGEEALAERRNDRMGLAAPELAVLMAYGKIGLYAELLESDLPEDPYLGHDLERYFPAPLPERFGAHMRTHRLRREIIATAVANQLVDRAGMTFAFRLHEETGASASILARAYAVAREIYRLGVFWEQVEALDNRVAAGVQIEMLRDGRQLVESATRWLVRTRQGSIDIAATVASFAPGVATLARALPALLDAGDRAVWHARHARVADAGVPPELAARVAGLPSLFAALDIVEVAEATERSVEAVAAVYFSLGGRLELNWLRDQIAELPGANRWQTLARSALREDLSSLHRALAQAVLGGAAAEADPDAAIDAWTRANAGALERSRTMLGDIRATRVFDLTTLPVALREVRNLLQDVGGAQAG
ncbi:MAG TPA: NAD-glutamate dehydrogenase [Solirubrobacteraceae bacterium]|nr:NAD-glutamate dehydrogenase [Solirubrobacteraceae bacterium]